MHFFRPLLAAIIVIVIASESAFAQPPDPGASAKFTLVVLENAAPSRNLKNGRVSTEAVAKVTGENGQPVAGVPVVFTIPQFSGGAVFDNGSSSSIVTTNSAGLASSGLFSLDVGTMFQMPVTASVPGGTLTAAAQVSTVNGSSTLGLSKKWWIVILAGGAVAGVVAATRGGGGSSTPSIQGGIGAAGAPTFPNP